MRTLALLVNVGAPHVSRMIRCFPREESNALDPVGLSPAAPLSVNVS
jgi:hypothetical protein